MEWPAGYAPRAKNGWMSHRHGAAQARPTCAVRLTGPDVDGGQAHLPQSPI
jgi:hypothetical protein